MEDLREGIAAAAAAAMTGALPELIEATLAELDDYDDDDATPDQDVLRPVFASVGLVLPETVGEMRSGPRGLRAIAMPL